jgi:integrase
LALAACHWAASGSAPGRRRLLHESKPSRSYLQPDQVAALLDAAGELDAAARERTESRDTGRRRPLLATLTLAGLRIGEALDLRWRHLRLPARKLKVPGTKTEAAAREVDLSPVLMELLMEYRARAHFTEPDDYVFATGTGRRDGESNVRRRSLAPAVEKANASLADDGGEPIEHVTPHSLRRTFISLLLASGADVPYVMAQAGHSAPGVNTRRVRAGHRHEGGSRGGAGSAHWAHNGHKARCFTS